MNTAKARRAKKLMDENNVTKGADNRTALIHAAGLEDLLGDSNATTIESNAIKALVDGDIQKWVGFTWIALGDRDEGGLPLSSSLRTNFFYDRQAVGLAIGLDFRTEVNYIPEKTSWLANGLFKAGSVAIDANGIVEVDTTE